MNIQKKFEAFCMEKNKQHYFYVLECGDYSYYAGYTVDVEKRFQAHQCGKGAKYTRNRGPLKILHTETYETKQEAMRKEYWFKQLSRKQKEDYMKRNGMTHATAKEL